MLQIPYETVPSSEIVLSAPGTVGLEESATPLTPDQRRARRKQAREKAAWTSFSTRQPAVVSLTLETSQPVVVPKQRSYNGTGVIRDELADRPCASLGLDGLLEELNNALGTEYNLDTPFLRPHLEDCISNSYDFGTAYGRLRPRWFVSFADLKSRMTLFQNTDRELRRHARDGNRIVNPRIPPRRVWDLYSNRVLPFWVHNLPTVSREIWAVSHSWMPEKQRHAVWTEINGREWPVPIPTDMTFDRLRIELLNLEAEYVWLDVLCLRQAFPDRAKETLRMNEWRLDVPTIGHIYQRGVNQAIVCYFSGLGRPFTVEKGILSSERHWLNRAWTLQENSPNRIIAGLTHASTLQPQENGSYGDSELDSFHDLLGRLVVEPPTNIFLALRTMQKRAAVNPVDKIAGLAYLLQATSVPIYDENEHVEDAWTRLVETMQDRFRADMLFLYPAPGDNKNKWRPSWSQILNTSLPTAAGAYVGATVTYSVDFDVYRIRTYIIQNCLVRGLAGFPDGDAVRKGEFVVEGSTSESRRFDVVAGHRQLIPEERYTLLGGWGTEFWVVAREREQLVYTGGPLQVEKVSVLRMDYATCDRLQLLNPGRFWDIILV